MKCVMLEALDTEYTKAWSSRNHVRVIELERQMQIHKETCVACGGTEALLSNLWRNQEVIVVAPLQP